MSGLTLVLALVTTPLRLNWLGEEVMGLLRVLLDALGYLVLLEFGIAAALSSLFATALARDDIARVRGLLRFGLSELFKITGWKVAGGIGVGVACLWLLDISPGLHRDFVVACAVGVAGVLVTPIAAFRSLLEGAQRGYTIQAALTLHAVVSASLSLWFAYLRWGVTGQIAAIAVGTLLSQGVLLLASRRLFPYLGSVEKVLPDPNVKAGVRRLNRSAFVSQVAGTVGLLSDNLLVAFLLGPRVVMTFFLTQRLAAIAQSQLQGIGTASWAGMAEIYARGDLALFNRRALELTRLVAVASMALLIPVTAFNRTFVGLWVGPELYAGHWVTGCAALVAAGQAVVSLWVWFFHATGQLPKVVPAVVATLGVNVVGSIVFTMVLGIAGPLLGTLASYAAVSSWCLPVLLRRSFGMSGASLGWALVVPGVVGVPVFMAARGLAVHPLTQGWLGLGVGAGATGLAYLVVAWLLVLGPRERREWLERMQVGTAWSRR